MRPGRETMRTDVVVSGARVLVTGASGFIGGHIARELRALGAVGASRSPQRDSSIQWVTPFDPTDLDATRLALRGVDVVVHAGGRAHVMRETTTDPLQAFRDANVAPTRTLAAAAAAEGVRRLILLSTVKVYRENEDVSEVIRPSTPLAPSSPYGISRMEAEEEARAIGASSSLEVVALRLPMVYGAGMKGNAVRLFDLVHSGLPLPLGAIRNERSMVFVGNIVAAVRGLLRASVPPCSAYIAADGGTVSTPNLIREIAETLHRPCRLVPLPLAMLRGVSVVGTSLLGSRFPLSADAYERLCGSLVVDGSDLERALGAPLPYSRIEGLRETAVWYLANRRRAQ